MNKALKTDPKGERKTIKLILTFSNLKEEGKLAKFSVVMPIHNEEKFLPYSLPSVFKLRPNEVILIFDRCTDRSITLSYEIAKHTNYASATRFIEINEPSPEWKFRVAFLRIYGFKLANNNTILNTDADIMLDPKIRNYLKLVGKNGIGLISFSRKEYPFTFQSFMSNLISTIIPKIGFTGTYAFSKEAFQETLDEKSIKKIRSAEDTYLYTLISRKYKTKFIKTKNVHLRPRENQKYHYSKGVARWQVSHDPLWKVFLHSIVYLRPMVFVGYMHAKQSKINKSLFRWSS